MFIASTKILVVDDMMTMRKILSKCCRDLGYTDITEAADGNQAWEAVNCADPAFGLIISDWNMPNCTGIELLKKVRGDGRFVKTPFLMVTAEAESHQVAEAVKSGVDNYVVKPFDKNTLGGKLSAIYKKYHG